MTQHYGVDLKFLERIKYEWCVDFEKITDEHFDIDYSQGKPVVVINEKNLLTALVEGMSVNYMALCMRSPHTHHADSAQLDIGKVKTDAWKALVVKLPKLRKLNEEQYQRALREHYTPASKKIYRMFVEAIDSGYFTNGVTTWEDQQLKLDLPEG